MSEPRRRQASGLPRRPWSAAEEQRLAALAPRLTAARIAHLLKRTRHAVTARAVLLGVRFRKRGALHHNYRHSDAVAREALRRYFREGQTVKRIAADLGIPWQTVVSYTSGQERPHLREEFMRP